MFPFPPPPPGYTAVLIARGLLTVWALIELCVLVARLRRWRFIRPREMGFWSLAAGLCVVVIPFGYCQFATFDNNEWLMPVETAAFSTSIAGIAMGLSKLYSDGSDKTKTSAIEMGVVVGFIGFLACILNPADLGEHEPYRSRTQCKNNLKQIGLALHNYHDVSFKFPASVNGEPLVSWRVLILPYLDRLSLFKHYNQEMTWDRPPNDQFALSRISELCCPANYNPTDAQERRFTAYSMPVGPHTIGEKTTGSSTREITDGTSNTALVVEACGAQIVWTEPRDVNISSYSTSINLKGNKPGRSESWTSSYHGSGSLILLGDGSVRFISTSTDPTVLKNLATIDGDEPLTMGEVMKGW